MKTKKINKFPTFAIFLIFITGIGLLFYPTISDFYNKYSNYQTIKDYEIEISNSIKVKNQQSWEEAIAYNNSLRGHIGDISNEPEKIESYNKALNLGDGMIGYIQINKINVLLPIYHGVTEEVLGNGIGHVAGSYLPTGEIGNHTVLTGHTGLPNAKLFSEIEQLKEGDNFTITVLDNTYYYEVKKMYVVEPNEVQFEVDKNKDLVTLVTCIPYGINSHRLLVEAEQIDKSVKDLESEFIQQQKETFAFVQGGLFGLVFGIMIGILIGIGFTILLTRLAQKQNK